MGLPHYNIKNIIVNCQLLSCHNSTAHGTTTYNKYKGMEAWGRMYPVAVLNAAFCMTCSLLMLVEDAIGDHTEEAYSRAGLITAL